MNISGLLWFYRYEMREEVFKTYGLKFREGAYIRKVRAMARGARIGTRVV